MPVAGLTALHALRQGGLLLGQKVLIDGTSGGVGHLAVQLAAASGAIVCGHVRREELRKTVGAMVQRRRRASAPRSRRRERSGRST